MFALFLTPASLVTAFSCTSHVQGQFSTDFNPSNRLNLALVFLFPHILLENPIWKPSPLHEAMQSLGTKH